MSIEEKFADERMMHSYGVAKAMYDKAIQDNRGKRIAEDAFVVGLLHDIGYIDTQEQHGHYGSVVLSCMGLKTKYTIPIYQHGDPDPKYEWDYFDYLLNYADMHVDHKGNFVTYAERLEDIRKRRGNKTVGRCIKVIEKIAEYEKQK